MLLQLGNLLIGQVQQGLAHMSSCHTAEGKDVFKDGHVSAKLHQLDQLGSGHLRLAGSLQIAALLGKNIQAVTVSPSEVKNNVDSGDFKVLCILGESRSSVVPEVETAQEMGYDITIQGWGGFAVPKDTPQAIVDILEEASEVAINSDSVKQTLADRGYEHAYLNGADMDAKAAEELAYYSELIPELGIA